MQAIGLDGMRFYAYHGLYEEERKIGGYYDIDLLVETSFDKAAQEDVLSGTINYEILYQICANEMKQSSFLLENVAQRIINQITALNAPIYKLKLKIAKINPPMLGSVARTYVEIEKKFN